MQVMEFCDLGEKQRLDLVKNKKLMMSYKWSIVHIPK